METKNKKPILIAAIVAVVVIIAGIAAAVASGVFLSKNEKVMLAFSKTFSEHSQFIDDLQMDDIAEWQASGNNTTTVNMDVDGETIMLGYTVKDEVKQMWGNIGMSFIPQLSFKAELAENQLRLNVPEVDERMFVYNYRESGEGYLKELLGEETLTEINSLLEQIYSLKSEYELSEKLTEALREEYMAMEFTDVEKREYTVDGSAYNCKGYRMTITKDDVKNMFDIVENVYKEYSTLYQTEDFSYEEMFTELGYDIEEMPDANVDFYIYKNQLACVSVTIPETGDEYSLAFKGGDYRSQNMELNILTADSDVGIKWEGTVDGTKEVFVANAVDGEDSMEAMRFVYDTKAGDFTFESALLLAEDTIGGKIISDSGKVTYLFDEFAGQNAELEFSFLKEAQVQEVEGEECNIMELTEMDILEIYGAFQNLY